MLYLLTDKGRAWRPSTPEQRGQAGAEARAANADKRHAADLAAPAQDATNQLSDINVADLADIRAAAGDPQGKLKPDELVRRIAGQYRDAGRMHDAVAEMAHAEELLAYVVKGGEIEPSEMGLKELAERAADELRNARAMVAKLEHLLQSARNEAEHLRGQIQHAGGDHEGAPIGRPLHALVEDLRGYLEDDQEITVTAGGRLIAVRSAGIGQVFEAPARELPDLLDALATAGKYCNVLRHAS